MTEQQIDFRNPEVVFAYVPSGKGTTRGTILMLAYGIITAIAVAVAVHFVGMFILNLFYGTNILLILVGLFISFLLIPLMAGYSLGWAIGQGAIAGKSRSKKTEKMIFYLCSFLAIILYCLLRCNEYDIEAFDSIIDYIRIIVILVFIVLGSLIDGSMVANKPFCENCKEYMKLTKSRKISPDEQDMVMNSNGEPSIIPQFFNETNHEGNEYTVIEIFYCNKCRKLGYLNVRSYIIRTKIRKVTESTETLERLVFSKTLTEKDLTNLETILK